ncbi:hypothetical protein RRG08_039501 [Elysia crispata]|uniref:Uncharacterized protein n=1 Tax=Elysia crispata TaxID=231223 RepID=A0AAE1CZW4_9GAST|nr:hypothetical protein RRG08_039501 [Elysia crispata]
MAPNVTTWQWDREMPKSLSQIQMGANKISSSKMHSMYHPSPRTSSQFSQPQTTEPAYSLGNPQPNFSSMGLHLQRWAAVFPKILFRLQDFESHVTRVAHYSGTLQQSRHSETRE